MSKDNIRETIYHHSEFTGFAESVKRAFDDWKADNWTRLNEINSGEHPKQFIEDISKSLLDIYDNMSLIDKYDVCLLYTSFMFQWTGTENSLKLALPKAGEPS